MKINTTRFKELAKSFLQRIRLHYLSYRDISRFSRHASLSVFDASYEQLCARIMYNVHAVEKGLSRGPGMRTGFGRKAFSNLNDALVMYVKRGYPTDAFPYIQGRSIIHRYLDAHQTDADAALSTLSLVDPEFHSGAELHRAAGTKAVFARDKVNNWTKGFYELAQGRSSIREFSGDPIDLRKVERCLMNAGRTPSVCNRQGWHVYLVTEASQKRELLRLQRGFKGYPTLPECVLVITVTNSAFLSPVERNEAFVDGGLFAMSVLYGLECEGLAAVPLNAMMNSSDERDIRQLVQVKASEQIIMFVAVGAFKEETLVPISDRKPLSDYLTYVN